MELIVMLVVAGAAGYLLAGSRFSKPIDQTGEKVAGTTRQAADRVEGWARGLLRRGKKPENEVIEGQAVEVPPADAPAADVPPAEKQPSRRKED
ncbi:MAG: hypothetical protein ACKOC5_08635 [Chloroflexota bacterium]